jgi:chromosome segregation ATPase
MQVSGKDGKDQPRAVAEDSDSSPGTADQGGTKKAIQPALVELKGASALGATRQAKIKFGSIDPDEVPKKEVESLLGRFNQLVDDVTHTVKLEKADKDNFAEVIPRGLEQISRTLDDLDAKVGDSKRTQALRAESEQLTRALGKYRQDKSELDAGFDARRQNFAKRSTTAAKFDEVIQGKVGGNAQVHQQIQVLKDEAGEEAAWIETLTREVESHKAGIAGLRSSNRELDEEFQANKTAGAAAKTRKEDAQRLLSERRKENAAVIAELKLIKSRLKEQEHQALVETVVGMRQRHEDAMAGIAEERAPLGDVYQVASDLRKENAAQDEKFLKGSSDLQAMQAKAKQVHDRHAPVARYQEDLRRNDEALEAAPGIEADISRMAKEMKELGGDARIITMAEYKQKAPALAKRIREVEQAIARLKGPEKEEAEQS